MVSNTTPLPSRIFGGGMNNIFDPPSFHEIFLMMGDLFFLQVFQTLLYYLQEYLRGMNNLFFA